MGAEILVLTRGRQGDPLAREEDAAAGAVTLYLDGAFLPGAGEKSQHLV
jgi:hypothetical protein